MYEPEYPEEDADVTILTARELETVFDAKAHVEHDEYGGIEVAHAFPKNEGWREKVDGAERFVHKLKDKGINKLRASQHFKAEKFEEYENARHSVVSKSFDEEEVKSLEEVKNSE